MNTKEMKAFSSLRCTKEKVNIAYLLALGMRQHRFGESFLAEQ